MSVLKVGIIGCGKQATKHIASLNKIPDTEIVFCDIRSDLAREMAEKNRGTWVQHAESLFSDNEIKAVVICTPTPTHAFLIKSAILSNKDVFCEKPLSDSIQDMLELKKLADNHSRIVMVGYIYRHVPVFEEGHRLFNEVGIEGKNMIMDRPLSAFFRLGGRGGHQPWKHTKTSGGGAINEMLVHMIDLTTWYFGDLENIEVISCETKHPKRVIQGKLTNVDAEDYVLIRCFGERGVEVLIESDLITPAFSQYVEIQSENGTFMGSIQPEVSSYVFLQDARGGYNPGKTVFDFGRRNFLDIQMMRFVQAVLKRELPDRNTIEDSITLMKFMREIRNQMA